MRWTILLAVALVCVRVGPVMAQEPHGAIHAPASPDATAHRGEADHGPQYKLLTIDGMTAVWTIIVFVILLIILRATAWKPIQKVLVEREEFIAKSLEQAQRERDEAEKLLAKYREQLEAARKEASAIVEEGRRDAGVVKQKLEKEARAEADATLQRAKREIRIATDTAVKELYSIGATLATDVASRIIRKELNPADHERLIAESLEAMEGIGGNGRSAT